MLRNLFTGNYQTVAVAVQIGFRRISDAAEKSSAHFGAMLAARPRLRPAIGFLFGINRR